METKIMTQGICAFCGAKSIIDMSVCYRHAALHFGADEFRQTFMCQECYDRSKVHTPETFEVDEDLEEMLSDDYERDRGPQFDYSDRD